MFASALHFSSIIVSQTESQTNLVNSNLGNLVQSFCGKLK